MMVGSHQGPVLYISVLDLITLNVVALHRNCPHDKTWLAYTIALLRTPYR